MFILQNFINLQNEISIKYNKSASIHSLYFTFPLLRSIVRSTVYDSFSCIIYEGAQFKKKFLDFVRVAFQVFSSVIKTRIMDVSLDALDFLLPHPN